MKVVFLDRDGVINHFPGHGSYVTKVADFKFIRGSKAAIVTLTKAGYKVFVISNQAGVGRGIFSQATLDQIDQKMHAGVRHAGGRITASFYCTHHPDAKCTCRKPGIANVKKAAKSIGVTLKALKGCFFIGDSSIDIKAGQAIDCQTILVLSGKSTQQGVLNEGVKPDYVVANLREAVKIILHENLRHTRHSRGRS